MLFRTQDVLSRNTLINNNPYLQDDNYDIVKSKIGDINIKFHKGNIFNLMTDDKKYDLVNLSNIIQYIPFDKPLEQYKEYIKSLPLSDRGVVFSYIISYPNKWKEIIEKSSLSDNYEYGLLTHKDDSNKDGYLLYKKPSNCYLVFSSFVFHSIFCVPVLQPLGQSELL